MFIIFVIILVSNIAKAEYCSQNDFFYLEFTPRTFDEQISQCAKVGGTLASFRGFFQLSDIGNEVMAPFFIDKFWVGIERVDRSFETTGEPNFPSNFSFISSGQIGVFDEGFFKETIIGVPPWAPEEPNGVNGEENCVAFLNTVGLSDESCSLRLPAICRVPNACEFDALIAYGISCVEEEEGIALHGLFGKRISFVAAGDTQLCQTGPFPETISTRPIFNTLEGFNAFTKKVNQLMPGHNSNTDIQINNIGTVADALYQSSNIEGEFLLQQVRTGNQPPWEVNQPNITTGACVIINDKGLLESISCQTIVNFACSVFDTGTCKLIPESFLNKAGTVRPTINPTLSRSKSPTLAPTTKQVSTQKPTEQPTISPEEIPSARPTAEPTRSPTLFPSANPIANPTLSPSKTPTSKPSRSPTLFPSVSPIANPTLPPSKTPTINPTFLLSSSPSTTPASNPTISPSQQGTIRPSTSPTLSPLQSAGECSRRKFGFNNRIKLF